MIASYTVALPEADRGMRPWGSMKILLFGATGMVGQGVLRECLFDAGVTAVRAVGRTATGIHHDKLTELVRADLFDYTGVEQELTGFDACFYCLGVSSSQVSGAEYERLTYALTMAVAGTLLRLNPQLTFLYVSGLGTDSTERGKVAWARVKGKTENALLRMPFRSAYMLRPAGIVPMHGEISRTPAYRFFYAVLKPLMPLLRRLMPNQFVTTVELGLVMLALVRHGAEKRVLESADLRAYASRLALVENHHAPG